MFLNENLLEMSFQYHQYHSTVSKDLYTLKMKPVDLSLLLAVKLTILQTLKFMLDSSRRPSEQSLCRQSFMGKILSGRQFKARENYLHRVVVIQMTQKTPRMRPRGRQFIFNISLWYLLVCISNLKSSLVVPFSSCKLNIAKCYDWLPLFAIQLLVK